MTHAPEPPAIGPATGPATGTVQTVLGPVPAADLGVTLVHESLLSVLPGAEHGYDVVLDRAAIFATLQARLVDFRSHGGGTLVDATGMFHGRDVRLLEALSRSTGVHIVASTGLGPEAMLGGYFRTPQTNPPTPWPAERFADLFAREVAEGMVVPRIERRGPAGLVVTAVSGDGRTPTDESLLRGAARAARETGVALSFVSGPDPEAELELVLAEGLAADRVVVGGLDRTGLEVAQIHRIARRGARVALDHVGATGADHLGDADRAGLVLALLDAGHLDRVLLSCSATGAAYGHQGNDLPYSTMLTGFMPLLTEHGLTEAQIRQLLVDNPARLLGQKGR